jgi:hypothetical protein
VRTCVCLQACARVWRACKIREACALSAGVRSCARKCVRAYIVALSACARARVQSGTRACLPACLPECLRVHTCVRACARARVRVVCVRACVRACVLACVRTYMCLGCGCHGLQDGLDGLGLAHVHETTVSLSVSLSVSRSASLPVSLSLSLSLPLTLSLSLPLSLPLHDTHTHKQARACRTDSRGWDSPIFIMASGIMACAPRPRITRKDAHNYASASELIPLRGGVVRRRASKGWTWRGGGRGGAARRLTHPAQWAATGLTPHSPASKDAGEHARKT